MNLCQLEAISVYLVSLGLSILRPSLKRKKEKKPGLVAHALSRAETQALLFGSLASSVKSRFTVSNLVFANGRRLDCSQTPHHTLKAKTISS